MPRPIGLHHFPLGATTELTQARPADFYMLGHSRIGDCVTKSGLFAAGGSPFMMQDIGGAITRACAALTHIGRV